MCHARSIRIAFTHCGPAGIVFCPRYFEMTHSVAENFSRDVPELALKGLMAAESGVAMRRIVTEFLAPARLGEVLDWRPPIVRIGGSSVKLQLGATSGAVARLTAKLVQVLVGPGYRPKRRPDRGRALRLAHQEPS